MKKLQWYRYQALELIPDQPPIVRSAQSSAIQTSPSRSWLQVVWQVIDVALFRDLEPRVWQSIDPHTGKTRWHLYNPETGKTRHLNSETEIRQWLEQILHR
jgi:hypothetical protein